MDKGLVIFDSSFPHPAAAFKVAEFTALLRSYPDTRVLSSYSSLHARADRRSLADVVAAYERQYPDLAGRVSAYDPRATHEGRLAYVALLYNAYDFLPALERSGLPFVLTLYPGGGFRLDHQESDARLRRLCSSPLFRAVIATQPITRDYLLRKGICDRTQVAYIYGAVLPSDILGRVRPPRVRWMEDKHTFDLCFVAYKYTPRGADKGYDVFIEVGKKLVKAHHDVRLHVVGPFSADDIDISELLGSIYFYGPRPTEFFPPFYARMDLILSPNAPFVLAPGAFDGFPTASCAEAGLCGVPVFCTDVLGLNATFKNGEEIVIVERNADSICATIQGYRAAYDQLCALGVKGQAAFERQFSLPAQMAPRQALLSRYLAAEDRPSAIQQHSQAQLNPVQSVPCNGSPNIPLKAGNYTSKAG